MILSLLALAFLTSPQAVDAGSLRAASVAPLLGTWDVALATPLSDGEGGAPVDGARLGLWAAADGVAGGLRVGDGTALVSLRADEAGQVVLDLVSAERAGTLEGLLDETGLVGTLAIEGLFSSAIEAAKIGEEVDPDLRLEVDLAVERPVTVDRAGLPSPLAERFQSTLEEIVARERMVGVSVAIVLDYEVADIRSVGWQDFARRVPATAKTRYRWASISKPVTAVAALQLAERGELDLDRDVREYVPEFPQKRWVVTARHLLSHQAGVVHYQHGPVRTVRTYDDPNPYRSRVLALDMFRESPLLFEPGTQHSYTTHGYALLGAVVERAGERRYADHVHAGIVERLGMTTMQPDFHQSVEIPDQAVGYAGLPDGRAFDSGDSNVAWKLAGGGFISNVEDLALFGLGLMEDELLDDASRAAMFTPRTTAAGEATGYGYGLTIEDIKGLTSVGHGGAQRKTRTHLRVVPEIGVGVAVMTNTEGTDAESIARAFLDEIIQ